MSIRVPVTQVDARGRAPRGSAARSRTVLGGAVALMLAIAAPSPVRAQAAEDEAAPERPAGADRATQTLPPTAADAAKANAFGQQGARQRALHQAARAAAARAAAGQAASAARGGNGAGHASARSSARSGNAAAQGAAGVARGGAARDAHGAPVPLPSPSSHPGGRP